MKRAIAVCALLLTGMIAGPDAEAAITTITMDELPTQLINGLSLKGVTFHDTTGAIFNSPNGGQQTYTQDPTILGSATDVITVDFAQPTPFVQFGMSLSFRFPLTPGFSVELFDPSLTSLGITSVNTSVLPGDVFTEGQFTHAGALVSRLVITFPPAFDLDFGFDNLSFDAGDAVAVPTLSEWAMMLMTASLLGFGVWSLRARSESGRRAA